jgi:hypothetical protein
LKKAMSHTKMKRHIATMIALSSENDAPEGPLRKRRKTSEDSASNTTPTLTLESLIRAGRTLLSEEEETSARVTPTKELHQHKETKRLIPVDRKAVSIALSGIANIQAPKPIRITPEEEKHAKDWMKICRPLAAPPRLPNVVFGRKCMR